MTEEKDVLVIDLGGTHFRYAVIRGMQIVQQVKGNTPDSAEEVLDILLGFVIPDGVEAVGICVPAPVKNGQLPFCPNIPGLENFVSQEALENHWRVPVALLNDANAAGLGEVEGAAKGASSFVFMTISTGIGGAIVLNGKVWEGWNGFAGELGHTVVVPGGPPTGAGIFGGLEAVASGPAMARHYNTIFGKNLKTIEACKELFALDDTRALAVVDHAVGHLSTAIHNLDMVLNPECFVLGGGVALHCPSFLELISDQIESEFGRKLDLRLAQLGDDAELFGAAVAAQNLIF
jgi:glucokinase